VIDGSFLRRARNAFELPRSELGFVTGAWMLARPISFGLKQAGFSRALEALTSVPPPRSGAAPVGAERGEMLVRKAFRAAACDVESSCLPRAMVQYLLHAAFGPPVRLVIGVPRPGEWRRGGQEAWGAHAWVEEDRNGNREPSFAPILFLTPAGGVVRVENG